MKHRGLLWVLGLLAVSQTALCDWHHHYGHSSGGTPDPSFDAFVVTAVLILASSLAILLLGGPLVVMRSRTIREVFWRVPLANFLFYVLSITLRTYPGGFSARFQAPGLTYTFFEIIILVISSVLVALILAFIYWSVRTVKRAAKRVEARAEAVSARWAQSGNGSVDESDAVNESNGHGQSRTAADPPA